MQKRGEREAKKDMGDEGRKKIRERERDSELGTVMEGNDDKSTKKLLVASGGRHC